MKFADLAHRLVGTRGAPRSRPSASARADGAGGRSAHCGSRPAYAGPSSGASARCFGSVGRGTSRCSETALRRRRSPAGTARDRAIAKHVEPWQWTTAFSVGAPVSREDLGEQRRVVVARRPRRACRRAAGSRSSRASSRPHVVARVEQGVDERRARRRAVEDVRAHAGAVREQHRPAGRGGGRRGGRRWCSVNPSPSAVV